jgi:hypothetical protein
VLVQKIGGDHFDPVEQVLDPLIAVVTGSANYSDYLVALGEQQLRQVGAVLSGHTGDKRSRQCGQWG